MTRQAYRTKTGKTLFKPVVTQAEYHNADDSNLGWCLNCGHDVEGVEPDARFYTCPECKQTKVFGLPELLVRGLLVLKATRKAVN